MIEDSRQHNAQEFCANKALTLLHKIGLLNDVLNDMDYLMYFRAVNLYVAWLTVEGQKTLGFHLKYLNLRSEEGLTGLE